jgi:antitoxin component YwqK of YwqJK toxin-antitoxin module
METNVLNQQENSKRITVTKYFDIEQTILQSEYTLNENNVIDGEYKSYYETGETQFECEYKNGLFHGRFTEYYENGFKHVDKFYKEDCLLGTYEQYYENGMKMLEYDISERGTLDKAYQSWFEDGKRRMVCYYENERRHGKYIRWWDNGHKREETDYYNDKPHGRCQKWYYDGKPFVDYEYKFGKVVQVVQINDKKDRDSMLEQGIDIVVWKAGMYKDTNVYIKILVPIEAKRMTPKESDHKYKSRIEFGVVIDIIDKKEVHYPEAIDENGKQYVPETKIKSVGWSDDPDEIAGSGIVVFKYKDACNIMFFDE